MRECLGAQSLRQQSGHSFLWVSCNRGLPRMWLLLGEGIRQRRGHSIVQCVLWRCQAGLLPVKPPKNLTWGAGPLECPKIRNAAYNYTCLLLPHLLEIMKVFGKLKILQQWQWLLHSYLPEFCDKSQLFLRYIRDAEGKEHYVSRYYHLLMSRKHYRWKDPGRIRYENVSDSYSVKLV